MRYRLIALSLLLVVAAVAGVWTRQAGPAQLALEAARKTEVVDRNLLAAIIQYRDVATKYESDGTVAPTALLQMAGCYEQLGQPEWRETYERIVKYYPESASAKTARAKLAEQRELRLTVTQLNGDQGDGTPFLDGRHFSDTGMPSGDLVVRDIKTGTTRALTHNAKKKSPSEYPIAQRSVPSPDGRQIAYAWAPSGVWELRVINFDGSQEKVLCCREKLSAVHASRAVINVYGWSGDGKQIFFSLGWGPAGASELMTVPAVGGVPRSLKQISGLGRAGWSPDGQLIVYDARPPGGKVMEHDLFIIRADGSNAETLVTGGANELMLHWFPDGKRILFLSDRDGSNSVWAQTITDGKAVGEPTVVKALVGDLRGQGFTKDGAYYYNVFSMTDDVYIARLNATGGLSGKLESLQSRFSGGKTGGVWSPDGSQIAYVYLPSGVVSGSSLSIQTISTRSAHTIPTQLKGIVNPVWMPDGRAIIVEGWNTEGGHGLFRVDLSSGAVSAIGELATTEAARRSYPAVSSNGREVFYALGHPSTGIQAQDLASGALRMVFAGPVMHFALSPDGRFVAIASQQRNGTTDQTPPVRIVPVAGGETRAIATAPAPAFLDYGDFRDNGFAWSADGRYLFFAFFGGSGPRATRLWRVPVEDGPAQPIEIPFPRQALLRIGVHPDGLLAIGPKAFNFEYWVMRNIPPAPKR